MKNFGIYQFYINKSGQEKNLLVGFVKAKSKSNAIKSFTDDKFKAGYLSALECSEKDFEKKEYLDTIKSNKKELGVWG